MDKRPDRRLSHAPLMVITPHHLARSFRNARCNAYRTADIRL